MLLSNGGIMTGIPSVIDLADTDIINGISGFRVFGSSRDNAGSSVASAGDVNGDGLADIIIGAPGEPLPSWNTDYAAYVIFGGAREDTCGLPPSIPNPCIQPRDSASSLPPMS